MARLQFSNKFLIGAAVGSGSTALAAERGGADMILALNAGRFRSMGAPSITCMLPVRDARTMTETFAKEELLAQCSAPVFLGSSVWGADLDPVAHARRVLAEGYSGLVNFPSCMHYTRPMQQILSRAGRGIEQEVAQLRMAQEVGLSSIFYCATRTQARLAADARLDFVCLNLGWNVGGALGHRLRTSVEEVATMAREIGRLIKRISPETRFLLEGGPIATPEDLGRVLSIAPIDGYIGGSTIERMPLEVSVADQINEFRQASRRRAALDRAGGQLVNWARRHGFVGRSPAQLTFLRRLQSVSKGRQPLMVVAENGADHGPLLSALEVHPSHGNATIAHIDCAGIDIASRARNILFGHRDTIERRQPALSDRDTGILAIHASERLPPAFQRRLARALIDGNFRVPGGGRSMPVVPRVVLICEVSLKGGHVDVAVEPELGAVFDGWTLEVPPLRERIEDLFSILQLYAQDTLGQQVQQSHFSAAALRLLNAHTWPGNEAELMALVGSLAGRLSGEPVQPEDIMPGFRSEASVAVGGHTEKEKIVDALWRNGFSRSRTADALGVSRKTLYNKMKKFNLTG